MSTNTKLLFAFILGIFFSNSILAQTYVGLKGGFNSSSTPLYIGEVNDIVGRTNHSSLSLSLPIDFLMNKNFSIQVEPTYTQEGTGISFRESSKFNYTTNIVSYIKLPVLAKFGLNLDAYKLFIMAGPSVSYGIGLKSYYVKDFPESIDTEKENFSFEEQGIKRFDYGISYGGGVETTLAKKIKMVIDVRCNLGLSDIDEVADQETYTESITLSMGLIVPMSVLLSKKEEDLSGLY